MDFEQDYEVDMVDTSCDTCAHKVDESRDENGERIVDCEINEFQMYSPYADECKHWESAKGFDALE